MLNQLEVMTKLEQSIIFLNIKGASMKYIITVIIVLLTFTGCSTITPIQKANESESQFGGGVYTGTVDKGIEIETKGEEIYRIFHRGSTGFTPISDVRSEAEARADTFCKNKSKARVTVSERHSNPPHILGNWPRIELLFFCDDKANNYDNRSISKYDDLHKLKKLFDDGLITQEEYNEEKKKILN